MFVWFDSWPFMVPWLELCVGLGFVRSVGLKLSIAPYARGSGSVGLWLYGSDSVGLASWVGGAVVLWWARGCVTLNPALAP